MQYSKICVYLFLFFFLFFATLTRHGCTRVCPRPSPITSRVCFVALQAAEFIWYAFAIVSLYFCFYFVWPTNQCEPCLPSEQEQKRQKEAKVKDRLLWDFSLVAGHGQEFGPPFFYILYCRFGWREEAQNNMALLCGEQTSIFCHVFFTLSCCFPLFFSALSVCLFVCVGRVLLILIFGIAIVCCRMSQGGASFFCFAFAICARRVPFTVAVVQVVCVCVYVYFKCTIY